MLSNASVLEAFSPRALLIKFRYNYENFSAGTNSYFRNLVGAAIATRDLQSGVTYL